MIPIKNEMTTEQTFRSVEYVRLLLRGAGQVMFQGNVLCGILFLCAIFRGAYAADNMAVAYGAVVGLIIATIAGYIVRLPQNEGEAGLWGFNGILVGCALPTFLGNTLSMWLVLIFAAACTTWIRVALNRIAAPLKINSLTFPFVLTTWVVLLAARTMVSLEPVYLLSHLTTHHEPQTLIACLAGATDEPWYHLPLHFAVYWLKGISQVFLIDDAFAGILFLLGLLCSSRRAAVWAGIGSLVALMVAFWWHAPLQNLTQGLYGYSAVLTAIALGATFYKPSVSVTLWTLCGILSTVMVQAALDTLLLPWGIPSLTAPFCITTWAFLLPMFRLGGDKANHSHWHKRGKEVV
jgi:urea transporter